MWDNPGLIPKNNRMNTINSVMALFSEGSSNTVHFVEIPKFGIVKRLNLLPRGLKIDEKQKSLQWQNIYPSRPEKILLKPNERQTSEIKIGKRRTLVPFGYFESVQIVKNQTQHVGSPLYPLNLTLIKKEVSPST